MASCAAVLFNSSTVLVVYAVAWHLMHLRLFAVVCARCTQMT
jgi:hypothetical protein